MKTDPHRLWRPSGITIAAILLALAASAAAAFVAGYIPMQKRRTEIETEAQEQERALPRVEVIRVERAPANTELDLPGSIQAITEAPILSRADGYVLHRMADIGDKVKAGQPLAEMEAPETDDQIRQAKAAVAQAKAGVDQAIASYERGKADAELARVTAERYGKLTVTGIISQHDNDVYQAQYRALAAAAQALEKAIVVQRGVANGAEANVARLERVQGYRVVKAPFDGVITQRNVDIGALVTAGNTLLFRIAQTSTVRTYVNVPQLHASAIRIGQTARVIVSNLPGRQFMGSVARTTSVLDPASRTLLVEIHVPNGDGALLPGMYAQVKLTSQRANPPLVVPSDAMIIRGEGSSVAVVASDGTVHLKKVEAGRDYGDRLEVISGLKEGDTIIPNPSDVVREGIKVQPVPAGK